MRITYKRIIVTIIITTFVHLVNIRRSKTRLYILHPLINGSMRAPKEAANGKQGEANKRGEAN